MAELMSPWTLKYLNLSKYESITFYKQAILNEATLLHICILIHSFVHFFISLSHVCIHMLKSNFRSYEKKAKHI